MNNILNKTLLLFFIITQLIGFVYAQDDHHDHEGHEDHSDHGDHHGNHTSIESLNNVEKWGYSFLGVTLGILVVFIPPIMFKCFKKEKMFKLLPWFTLFGSGAILSLIINHNIPEIIETLTFDWTVGSVFITGVICNYIGIYGFTNDDHCCEIDNNHCCEIDNNTNNNQHHDHENQIELPGNKHSTKHWAIGILIGDAFCNFSDGLIITSAFHICGHSFGWIVVLTVILHELSHEIGDFALLINSGIDFKRGVLMNFLSACTSYIGWLLVNLLLINDSAKSISVYFLTFGSGVILSLVMALIPKYIKNPSLKIQRYRILVLLSGIIITTFIFAWHTHC